MFNKKKNKSKQPEQVYDDTQPEYVDNEQYQEPGQNQEEYDENQKYDNENYEQTDNNMEQDIEQQDIEQRDIEQQDIEQQDIEQQDIEQQDIEQQDIEQYHEEEYIEEPEPAVDNQDEYNETYEPVQEEVRVNKKDKHKKQNKQGKQSKKDIRDIENTQPEEKVLYIITDRELPGDLRYYREAGLNVSCIFHSITKARGKLLMQSEPTRIVIIDTGTGKFMTTAIRGELIDMIGVNDEDNNFSIFYTDSALKSETLSDIGKIGKTIEWVKYSNTVTMIATMLQKNEVYIDDSSVNIPQEESSDSILNYVGVAGDTKIDEKLVLSMTGDSIKNGICNENTEQIPGFVIRL